MRKRGFLLASIVLGLATQLSAADEGRGVEVKSAVAGVETEFTVARGLGGANQRLFFAAPRIAVTESKITASTPAEVGLPPASGEITLHASVGSPALRIEVVSNWSEGPQVIIAEGRSIRLEWDDDGTIVSVWSDEVRIRSERSADTVLQLPI